MGDSNRCFVELATKTLRSEQVERVEDICNELIRQGVLMTPRWITPDSPDMETVIISHNMCVDAEHTCVDIVCGRRTCVWI